VRTNTQGSAVNTAEATISYSTDTLDLVRVNQGPTFYLPAPGSPSIGSGTAYFGGGLPTPGYNGTAGTIGSMTFRAKAAGTATISVSSGKVLLNDGFGTNALSGTAGSTFQIAAAPPPPPPGASTSAGNISVSSSTHPDPEKWYAVSNLELNWDRPSGIYGYSFELDQQPNTVPDNELDTTITTKKSYPGLTDGVWYFHIKGRAQSASAAFQEPVHFKINVDTKAPAAFTLSSDDSELTFETTDETSGIDRYEIVVGGEVLSTDAKSPFDLSQFDDGKQDVKVVAIDKAGNKTEATLTLNIVKSGKPFYLNIIEVPLYALVLLLLLIIGLIIYLLRRRNTGSKEDLSDDISRIQKEVDESLEILKQQITFKLSTLTASSSEKLYEKESQVAQEIRGKIVKTRKRLDSKMTKMRRK
jgi:hypothetical protein